MRGREKRENEWKREKKRKRENEWVIIGVDFNIFF